MSKQEIIETIKSIDEQLKQNRAIVEVHSDDYILMLCELSKLLIEYREMLQDMLLYEYGVFYMRGAQN